MLKEDLIPSGDVEYYIKNITWGRSFNSVVQYVLSMHEALVLIPSTTGKKYI